ncbi:MAG: NUDIX hydrolase [Bacteroidetes bacterium]|nr:NUDIX hydrolase [Bacteroidota bacterium]MBL6962245.1 NUDIX hydrolase [Bacteroidota bacterium]
MKKIQLKSRKNLFAHFVGVDEFNFHLTEQKCDVTRYVVSRPEAAAILLYNRDSNAFVFIRQFRTPVFTKGEDGFIIEIPAGVLEPGEEPLTTIVRETLEETGYSISKPELLYTFYPSPGILNEKMHLYYAEVKNADKIEKGGGLETEKEFLEVIEIPVDQALQMVNNGRIIDAKTMLAVLKFHQSKT